MDFNEKDVKIVRVNNLYDFDFTGDLGARLGGRDFLIPAGGSLLTPLSVGEHLAKHLARAKLIKDADKVVLKPGEEMKALWDDALIERMIKEILSDELTETKAPVKSQDDLMEEKVRELNKQNLSEEESVETPKEESGEEEVEETETAPEEKVTYKDKAQVIAELKKRGVTFDSRAPKATLEALLK